MADRLHTAVLLYTFAILGIFLVVVPWTPVWDRATLSLLPTSIGLWVRSDWVKGTVSVLGTLDLLVAAREAGNLWRLLRKPEPRSEEEN